MPTFKQKRVLKYISDKDTSTLTFDDECVLKEFDKESSLDDLVYKCLYYTNSYYSWVEIYPGMFEIETISGKWRSSLDIWRHVKHFRPEATIFEVMNSLYNIKESLVGHYCPDIRRRVFKLNRFTFTSGLIDLDCPDEYGLYFEDWREINVS